MDPSRISLIAVLLSSLTLGTPAFLVGPARSQIIGRPKSRSQISSDATGSTSGGNVDTDISSRSLTPSEPRKKRKSKAQINAQRRRHRRHSIDSSTSNTRATSIAKGKDPLISLNMNLDYLAKTGRAEHAEELLLKIEGLFAAGYYDIRPDSVSYNSVMNAYALKKSDDPNYNSAAEVMRLLKRMEDLTEEGQSTVQPNVVTLNTVIATFAKDGETEKAKQLLEDMEKLYQSGQKDMSPNTISYNTLIAAFAKAKMPLEAENTLKLMMRKSREDDDARADEIKADAVAFNTVSMPIVLQWKSECEVMKHLVKL